MRGQETRAQPRLQLVRRGSPTPPFDATSSARVSEPVVRPTVGLLQASAIRVFGIAGGRRVGWGEAVRGRETRAQRTAK